MGMPGGATERIRRTADAAAAEALARLSDARRAENMSAATVVHAVRELSEIRFATENDIHELGVDYPDLVLARRTVECEAAVTLALSKKITHDMITVGDQLAWRLPAVDAAFVQGDLDYPRVRTIALNLERACDATVAALEADILAAALRMNTRSLREAVWKAWFSFDAEEASAAQKAVESEERRADVKRNDDGTATLIAKMSSLEGAECSAVLDELAGTVCSGDPRSNAQLRCFALHALVHREDYIACRCGRRECPVRPLEDRQSERRTPLIQIMIDIEPLLGLTSEPATLADGTVLDPAVAREIAGDARWQMFLTEMLEAARTIDDAPGSSGGSGSGGSGSGSEQRESKSAAASEEEQRKTSGDEDPSSKEGSSGERGRSENRERSAEDTSNRSADPGHHTRVAPEGRARARRILRRGRTRQGASVPKPSEPTRSEPTPSEPTNSGPTATRESTPTGETRTAGSGCGGDVALSKSIAEFMGAVSQNPELANGIHPDGHGGYTEPPPGALTYRPSAELVALTRATHCSCTFPGCSTPAARCEIDHIVPFDHRNPLHGGWTILSNLQPLCKFHHQAKTMKLWAAARLLGDSIYWVSTAGLHRITPSTFGTVMVPASFTHNSPSARHPAPQQPDSSPIFECVDLSTVPDPHVRPVDRTPSDALWEPTWWESNISESDTEWSSVASLGGSTANRSVRVPTLGDIARMKDPQQRADATFLRERFLEHRAVIAARDRLRAPPF
nr:HNH endonuclease signature motif containing protein [Rhodococcus sp. (in: high G+C Gram-positive bacteria)]